MAGIVKRFDWGGRKCAGFDLKYAWDHQKRGKEIIQVRIQYVWRLG